MGRGVGATPAEISATLSLSCTPTPSVPRPGPRRRTPTNSGSPLPPRAPRRRPPRREGHQAPATHLHAGSLGSSEGARDAIRARPADSNFVALGTAQSSLPRRAGGAVPAVTQQLARRRAGLCSLLPRPRPGSARLRAAPSQTLGSRCCSGCGSFVPTLTLLLGKVRSETSCSPLSLKDPHLFLVHSSLRISGAWCVRVSSLARSDFTRWILDAGASGNSNFEVYHCPK
eukprot:XP_017170780.1 PREDICTED: uncharacterized protein LOC108167961 [Mus musculus]